MNKIFSVNDCFGCGLCSVVCKHGVIDMKLNQYGFFQPSIVNPMKCVDCGLCAKVCSFLDECKETKPLYSYAGWSKDRTIVKSSTSGGVSYEIAKSLMNRGYKFCGVRYNVALERAEHYIAYNIESLRQSKGSKYLQSYTKEAFEQVDKKLKYLVIGTPCQIASFRKYINLFHCSNNFILIDFFCHGVPSYLLWRKYLKDYGSQLGTIRSASWRNKSKGWHGSYCITLEGEKDSYQSWSTNDDFFTMFLGDACLGKACFESCKFKYNCSAADIRIGDFWGKQYQSNNDGVCSVVVFSERGNEVLHNANLNLFEYSFDIVADGQLRCNPQKPWYYEKCMKSLMKDDTNLANIARPVKIVRRFSGHINRLMQLLNK